MSHVTPTKINAGSSCHAHCESYGLADGIYFPAFNWDEAGNESLMQLPEDIPGFDNNASDFYDVAVRIDTLPPLVDQAEVGTLKHVRLPWGTTAHQPAQFIALKNLDMSDSNFISIQGVPLALITRWPGWSFTREPGKWWVT